MLDRADCADFGCHNSIKLETKHFLNTLALTFISFSGRFVFAMQKTLSFFFCERSSSLYLHFSSFQNILVWAGSVAYFPFLYPPPVQNRSDSGIPKQIEVFLNEITVEMLKFTKL